MGIGHFNVCFGWPSSKPGYVTGEEAFLVCCEDSRLVGKCSEMATKIEQVYWVEFQLLPWQELDTDTRRFRDVDWDTPVDQHRVQV
jgi:hypothetical protein